MALLDAGRSGPSSSRRMFGAALISGDGAITPAISVLSALEGVEQIAPAISGAGHDPILLALSRAAVRNRGIGHAFGPIMCLGSWIGALGIVGILRHPPFYVALDPLYGLSYLVRAASRASSCSAACSCASRAPRRSTPTWGISAPGPSACPGAPLSFPALILNYAGQAAIVLAGAPTEGNIYYRLCIRRRF